MDGSSPMMVRFAVVCDACETRGYEYGGGYSCRECDVEMSDRCACPQSKDEESGRALCPRCASEPDWDELWAFFDIIVDSGRR